ncbi:hypothetical protein [Dyadobacter sp. CY343]|uniref:hypothetical protein n=1 Tax=Dyadobacter sp. CY343 TaxID=2907299 RepID=UPI001F166ABD|nr:hypothetical protein [Dyadobacter sp. CY343]MCE7059826.1 hypothetical protein [Dyadobacter sp. CY343]
MILQQKSLEKLRNLINEETEYRSGPKLVSFFNELGFKDVYEQGFPSRWVYTDEKLAKINGTPELDKCIKRILMPVNFIGRFGELDKLINDFNQYLAFDNWKVIRKEKDILFIKADKIDFDADVKEEDFLSKEFHDVSIDKLELDAVVSDILKSRIDQIKRCISVKAPLAAIFLSGSVLEGILLGMATKNPKDYNQAKTSPRDKEGKTKMFHQWTLSNFIDVSHELGYIKDDVRKFSHARRDFRNYIHPYEQMSSRFNPDEHTAEICWQVLKAAISQLAKTSIVIDD